ncbi:MAG: envelope stress response membrane protein PspB [Woeseia sp.]|nr:envelope stress response membrane protein PspB [Woeseiaceae bacterium]
MGELFTVALIVFIAVPVPLFIILHFITKWKQTREMSGGDERMIEDLWELSSKLEDRMETLETILDNEQPEWRRNR